MSDDDLIRRSDAVKVCRDHEEKAARQGRGDFIAHGIDAEAIAALPARGVGVPTEVAAWVRRLRKTEEAGHAHHLSKADRLAIADFLAALEPAPTDAAQVREAALLQRAAQLAYEVWDDPEALAKAILALVEART